MTVWIVHEENGYHDDLSYEVIGVFTTKEKADNFVKDQGPREEEDHTLRFRVGKYNVDSWRVD